jgi:hypothetical protein
MSLELIRLVGVWSGCWVVRDAPPLKNSVVIKETNFHCCTVHFHDSVTISYQQMHQIHLLFNTVLIIYIKIS